MKATQYPGIHAGKNAIRMEFTYRGVRCRETARVEPSPGNVKLFAKRLEEIKILIALGKFDYANELPESKNAYKFSDNKAALLTVKEMCDMWYRHSYKHWAYSTEKANRGRMDKHIIPNFGKVVVSDFKPSTFHEWQNHTNLSAKTANEVRNLLSQAFDYLVFDDVIEANPIKKTKRLKEQVKEVEPFSHSERTAILAALPEGAARDFYDFAMWTGLRTGEQIALQWKNVDIKQARIYVRASVVKGRLTENLKTKGSMRTVDLEPQALEILQRIDSSRINEVFVFTDPRTNKRWAYDGVPRERFWTHALKAAKVAYRKPYTCRHTYASTMLSTGRNPMWVAQQMGHSDWGMIRKVYGRWIQ
ncbi:MAG: tyrosine-type recombinase/integrase [Idiomarina sp.]|nr:tyrosine-type recombinase/integrase [Idiomarina sp.]